MALQGWYYLHTNGSLIYKRELGGTAADIRESDFARAMWPLDPADRAGAWRIGDYSHRVAPIALDSEMR
jgi:hypothetical protein